MGNQLRYRLALDLHHLVHDEDDDGGGVMVVTVRRWDCINSAQPRSLHIVLEDGAEVERTLVVKDGLARLSTNLAQLVQRVHPISDQDARARITARTGIVFPETCLKSWCGEPLPLGSDRCTDWHAAGQGAAGSNRPGMVVMSPAGGAS